MFQSPNTPRIALTIALGLAAVLTIVAAIAAIAAL